MYNYFILISSCEAAVELLKKGAMNNKSNKIGNTPLHCAASAGQLETLQVIIQGLQRNNKEFNLRQTLKEPNLASLSAGGYGSVHANIAEFLEKTV